MLILALKFYIVLVLTFAIRSVLLIESDVLSLNVTRSREAKVTLKKSIEKRQRMFIFSLIWPVIIWNACSVSIKYYLQLKRDEKESSS